MPLTMHIIPCLDVTEDKVVKGVQFINLKEAEDTVELAKFYNEQGVDELEFLEITISSVLLNMENLNFVQ